jgi:hypothetical protein
MATEDVINFANLLKLNYDFLVTLVEFFEVSNYEHLSTSLVAGRK